MNYSETELQMIKNRLAKDDSYVKSLAIVAKELPDFKEKVYAEAEDSLKGMILLPGTKGIKKFVGNPPEWYVRMGDDNEFLWQLSRMNHWTEMLQRFVLTGEEDYAKKVIQEFEDWHEKVTLKFMEEDLFAKDPNFYNGVHPMRLLECGIRLYKTWPFFIRYLANTPYLTTEILDKYMTSVHLQASLIYKYAPILWPDADHNHYLMENLGLLTTALMFPEFEESVKWKEHAIHELNRGSLAQLTEEGGQIEGCPSYHNGCMLWFGLLPILAEKYQFELPKGYIERYESALNYSVFCLRPTGRTTPFGDSHANYGSIMSAAIGYLATKKDYWLRHLLQFYSKEFIREESINNIRFGNHPQAFIDTLNQLEPLNSKDLLPTTLYNHQLGQLFTRDSWTKNSYFLGFSARSPIQNAHAHIDMLTFEFGALGKNIICDPGLFAYRDDPDREYFKTTKSHSTVMINDQNFFEYIRSFGFGPQKESHLISSKIDEDIVYVSGYNLAYEPTEIYRHLVYIKETGLVVIDEIKNRNPEDKVRRNFHLDYTKVEVKGENTVIAKDEKVNTKILNYPLQDMDISYGRLSDVNDTFRPSQELTFSDKKPESLYATLLVPFLKDTKEPEVSIAISERVLKVGISGKILSVTLGKENITDIHWEE